MCRGKVVQNLERQQKERVVREIQIKVQWEAEEEKQMRILMNVEKEVERVMERESKKKIILTKYGKKIECEEVE